MSVLCRARGDSAAENGSYAQMHEWNHEMLFLAIYKLRDDYFCSSLLIRGTQWKIAPGTPVLFRSIGFAPCDAHSDSTWIDRWP